VSRRFAHEAKAGEVACLALRPLILLWAGGVVPREVEVAEGSISSGHHLLKLLLLVPRAVLLLIVTFAIVVPLDVAYLLEEESSFFLLGQSAMKWVVSPHSKHPLGDLPLSLWNMCKAQNFLDSRTISSSWMLSYCSSEAAHKEDKASSKVDESVVLVGLATWPPTRVLVTKALLVREASWFGRPYLDNLWDFNLLNNFSVSRVAKSVDSSKAVIFMPHTESSRAYSNCLACSLSE
jgi:hypothetical protein